MVAPIGSIVGRRPVPCLAPEILREAHYCLEIGDDVGVGVRIREALRRYLEALCNYHDCLPSQKRRRSPSELLKALCCAYRIDEEVAGHCREILACADESAAGGPATPTLLNLSCAILWELIETTEGIAMP